MNLFVVMCSVVSYCWCAGCVISMLESCGVEPYVIERVKEAVEWGAWHLMWGSIVLVAGSILLRFVRHAKYRRDVEAGRIKFCEACKLEVP